MCTFCFVWDAVLVHSAAQSQCDTVVVADFLFLGGGGQYHYGSFELGLRVILPPETGARAWKKVLPFKYINLAHGY